MGDGSMIHEGCDKDGVPSEATMQVARIEGRVENSQISIVIFRGYESRVKSLIFNASS